MRIFLWLLLIGGIVSDVIAVFMADAMMKDLAKAPAIVIVPQLILAATIGGFGTLTMAIAAAGVGIMDRLDRRPAGGS